VPLQVRLAAALRDADAPDASVRLDLRAIAATGADLEELVRRGAFWKDLYELLRAAQLRVPALRERREDIPLLADHFLARAARARPRTAHDHRRRARPAARLPLARQHARAGRVLERAADLAADDAISRASCPHDLGAGDRRPRTRSRCAAHAGVRGGPDPARAARHRGQRTRAARLLEISHRALLYKLKELGLVD
jgi:two-component system response regulator AtoC